MVINAGSIEFGFFRDHDARSLGHHSPFRHLWDFCRIDSRPDRNDGSCANGPVDIFFVRRAGLGSHRHDRHL